MSAKDMSNQGWGEYSKLVLSELERLDEAQKETKKEINEKLDKLLSLQQSVVDLKKWKEEKAEPDIQSLKEFKEELKKQKKSDSESDSFHVFLKEKKEESKDYDDSKREFIKAQKRSHAIESKRDFTEEEELNVFLNRPRYEYRKRALFGAKPNYKVATKSTSSSPTSTQPEFGTDSGYIPPPPPPPMPSDMPNEPFYDEIPPPPPPPLPSDFGNDFGDGYIPPPPPPPMFDGEF